MSKFYVIKTQDAIDGIDGLPITQIQVNRRNGTPLSGNEVAQSRTIFSIHEYSKWNGSEIVEMTAEEQDVWNAHVLAEWQSSEEYANRLRAIQIIGAIQGTLIAIGVDANEKSQVFADVDAWVQTSENDSEKISRLETAMRLQTYYVSLIELVGDATGLINGERKIDLTLGG